MKQKVLIKIMILCILALLLNVNAINAAVSKSKDNLKKKELSPAEKFYKDFQNNAYSGPYMDINVKNQDCENILTPLCKMLKIPIDIRMKKQKLFSAKLTKVRSDLFLALIILKCDLDIELFDDKLIITNNRE